MQDHIASQNLAARTAVKEEKGIQNSRGGLDHLHAAVRMAPSRNFLTRWLLLVALVATIFTVLYFTFTQNEQNIVQRFHLVKHPKFKLANMIKNESTVEKSVTYVKSESASVASHLSEDDGEYSVQIFYYPWYGNPKFDSGEYYHWNHRFIPHWDSNISHKYPRGSHIPPLDIGSSFYPLLGSYSSRDPAVIEQHMKWMSSAGIDVVIVSWYPPKFLMNKKRKQLWNLGSTTFYKIFFKATRHPWNDLISILLDIVAKYRMKLSFHLEPYKNRNGESLRSDIEYIIDNYGNHSALYRMKRPKSRQSLLVKSEDRHSLLAAGFDGIYTYFAAVGFSYGSTPSNWPSLSAFCRKNDLIFIPSVGPGYDDRRVRPWNSENYKDRMNGKYYADMFEMAHVARANIITITSFNEWHEGTQIEPAIPFIDNNTGFVYSTYVQGPEQYLHQTLDLIKKYFTQCIKLHLKKLSI
ncbi:Glycoprotein endo-alpha-1,2-mannosidase [Dirofilaria immitis]|nr:Glycoprotein endo-alpha-1,2-mannosidase [Dirofilaria immitis]